MPKHCPICGELLEEGLCINCGYDATLEGPLSIGSQPKPKKESGSLFDDLLDLLTPKNDDPLL